MREQARGPVKALSIMQPWAWLIVNGHKHVENRDCWCELTFGEYLRHSAVRVAA